MVESLYGECVSWLTPGERLGTVVVGWDISDVSDARDFSDVMLEVLVELYDVMLVMLAMWC